MQENELNPYKRCRENAGITQEKAAELLHVSVESMRAYEGDKRAVPNDVVLPMMDIYNAPYLGTWHLRYSSELGKRCLPEVKVEELPSAVLQLLDAVQKFVAKREALISITADGKITADEREQWSEILDSVDVLQRTLMQLRFSKERG